MQPGCFIILTPATTRQTCFISMRLSRQILMKRELIITFLKAQRSWYWTFFSQYHHLRVLIIKFSVLFFHKHERNRPKIFISFQFVCSLQGVYVMVTQFLCNLKHIFVISVLQLPVTVFTGKYTCRQIRTDNTAAPYEQVFHSFL